MTTPHPANIDIAAALAEAVEQYRARNPKSLAQYETACASMPGGNTRSAIFVEPFPLTMAKGEGSRLWDLDGHEYIDFLSEFTAGILAIRTRRSAARSTRRSTAASISARMAPPRRGLRRRSAHGSHRSIWCASPTAAPRPT